jgi:hypothetical protein
VRSRSSCFFISSISDLQGHEAGGEDVAGLDLIGRHFRKLLPSDAGGELHAYALLEGFAARHGDAGRRPVAQVVALCKKVHLAFHDAGLGGRHARHDAGKGLVDIDRSVAGGLRFVIPHKNAHRGDEAGNQDETFDPICIDSQEFLIPHPGRSGCLLQSTRGWPDYSRKIRQSSGNIRRALV